MKTVIMAVLSFLFLGCRTMTISKEYTVTTVDYDQSIEGALVRGDYKIYYANGHGVNIKNFLSNEKGTVKLKMKRICFDVFVRPARVLSEMDKIGFRPVNLQELLAYFEIHPLAAEGQTVGALRSLWYDSDEKLLTPVICEDKRIGGRTLVIESIGVISHERETEGLVKQNRYNDKRCFIVVPK